MSVTAAMVKELRERTGAGMMECKKALVETDGNIDAAADLMRKSGQAKADKKAGRIAAEGSIVIERAGNTAAIVEVNCETDFVAKDENFGAFASKVAAIVQDRSPTGVEDLYSLPYDDTQNVDHARRELIAKIGEKIDVRRFESIGGGDALGAYLHGRRIGVVVAVEGGDEELAKDIAMHIAASAPECLSEDGLAEDRLAAEREIYLSQVRDSGKPAEILDKIVDGKMRKFINGITLLGQAFVKDDKMSVGQLLKQKGAKVLGYARYQVGEGIEKREENFAEEVRKQVEASDN